MDCWRNGVEWIPLIIITVFIGSNPLFTVIILLLLFCLSGAWTFFVELIMEWENSEFLNGIIDEAKEVNGAAPRGFVFSLFGLHSAGPLSRCFLHKRKETSFLLITEWLVMGRKPSSQAKRERFLFISNNSINFSFYLSFYSILSLVLVFSSFNALFIHSILSYLFNSF